MLDINIERYLPHRERMKLIDKVLEVGNGKALTLSVSNKEWPLFEAGYVNPIILIELAAQSAGICLSMEKEEESCKAPQGVGWIVGIKSSRFYVDKIPENSEIIITTIKTRSYESYAEITGIAEINKEKIGEVILQLMSNMKE